MSDKPIVFQGEYPAEVINEWVINWGLFDEAMVKVKAAKNKVQISDAYRMVLQSMGHTFVAAGYIVGATDIPKMGLTAHIWVARYIQFFVSQGLLVDHAVKLLQRLLIVSQEMLGEFIPKNAIRQHCKTFFLMRGIHPDNLYNLDLNALLQAANQVMRQMRLQDSQPILSLISLKSCEYPKIPMSRLTDEVLGENRIETALNWANENTFRLAQMMSGNKPETNKLLAEIFLVTLIIASRKKIDRDQEKNHNIRRVERQLIGKILVGLGLLDFPIEVEDIHKYWFTVEASLIALLANMEAPK